MNEILNGSLTAPLLSVARARRLYVVPDTRLEVARLHSPVLVFDEPSEGLDLVGRQMVRDLVKTQKERGKAVLFVSHVLTEVEQFCDRVGVIVAGKLAYLGSLADLLKDPQTSALRPLETALKTYYIA